MVASKTSASGKILHNSLWYGLEQIVEAVVFLGTNIAVARYLGPEKLGYFSYINLFVTIVTRTGGTGLANATRKYMTEYLALDQPGTARGIYRLASRYQFLAASTIATTGILLVLFFGNHGYRLMSVILLASIVPGLMSWVPAHANQAFEDVSQNTISALCYIVAYTTIIVCTIHFRWDLVGIASALFVGRTVEVILRTIPLHARLRTIPLVPLSDDLVSRIRRFCLEAIGLQLLMSVIWDRTELVFLKAYSSLEQLAFYSVSFGLANNLLLIPRTFGAATGITLMAETSRDATRVDSIVRSACRYLLFVVFPVHLGAAAITREAVHFAYGIKYAGAVPVLIIASILSMPRAFQELAETLIKTADKQKPMLVWLSITGVVNIGLDWLLIPRYGAVGAAWGNGIAQTFGIFAIWQLARRCYVFTFPVFTALRFCAAASLMAGAAFYISREISGLLGIILAVLVAMPLYIVLVKQFRGLCPEDRERLELVSKKLPASMRGIYKAAIDFATPDPVAE